MLFTNVQIDINIDKSIKNKYLKFRYIIWMVKFMFVHSITVLVTTVTQFYIKHSFLLAFQ
jgi:hypothetical protein